MDRIKLTKKAISEFIIWSTSKYNEYKKEEIVDQIHTDFITGEKSAYEVSYGSWTENKYYGHNSQGTYFIDPINRTIVQRVSGRTVSFFVSDINRAPKKTIIFFSKGQLKYKKEKRTWFKEVIKTEKWRKLSETGIVSITHNGKWIKCNVTEAANLTKEEKAGLLKCYDFLPLVSIKISCLSGFESE